MRFSTSGFKVVQYPIMSSQDKDCAQLNYTKLSLGQLSLFILQSHLANTNAVRLTPVKTTRQGNGMVIRGEARGGGGVERNMDNGLQIILFLTICHLTLHFNSKRSTKLMLRSMIYLPITLECVI